MDSQRNNQGVHGLSFDPALPRPYDESWRKAYRYNNDDSSRLSAYQPPGSNPVPFIFDNIRLSGGQSLDTAEYPFNGKWSSTPLNEKPHSITVSAFIRGENYIKNRNALVEALRITTSDDSPGFIDLPLWGRFPIVVITYEVEEKGKENGKCFVSMTFVRAGLTVAERWQFSGNGFDMLGQTSQTADDLGIAAAKNFQKILEGNTDIKTLAQGFTQVKSVLLGIVGGIQTVTSQLNSMTNAVLEISNLIAQGINSPWDLANAAFGGVDSIVAGVLEMFNSFVDPISNRNRSKNAPCLQFLSANTFSTDIETATIKQLITKESVENLYRTMALTASAQIMVKMDMTYEEAQGFLALYERLDASINQNDPEIYRAVRNMRLALVQELSARRLDNELLKTISLPAPLLSLTHTLGCSDTQLRRLNNIDDSFVIKGDVIYV